MHAQNPLILMLIAGGLLAPLNCGGTSGSEPAQTQSQVQMAVQKVAMGDYEVVEDWPKPLPDTDLSHDGWTWGSGAGVWAESPDKVWVSQRGEIRAAAWRHAMDLPVSAHSPPHEYRQAPLFRKGL